MRLTLRTLLAYRDGVLDNKDALLLESKLRDSVTAQQISQRIDEGMSNPKLAPIPIDAKEFGFDPNHIAEYLDDTIPVDQIPAMERCCLENNALLSEVGSCHRILTKALTAPLDVTSELRERILSIPLTPNVKPSRLKILRLGKDGSTVRFDAPKIGKFEAAYSAPSSETGFFESGSDSTSLSAVRLSPTEPRGSGIELNEGLGHQVPEYLIGYDRSWLRTAFIGFVMVALLVVVGVLAIGPVDQLKSMLTAENPMVKGESKIANTPPKTNTKKSNESEAVSPQPQISNDPDTNSDTLATDSKNRESKSGSNANLPNAADAILAQNPTEPTNSETADQASAVGEASETMADSDSSIAAVTGSAPDSSVTSGTLRSDLKTDVTDQPKMSLDEPVLKWLPESKESSESLVLYGNPVDPESQWQKVSSGASWNLGDVIVPSYQRTEFVNGDGVRIIVCDATHFECQGPKNLAIPYGKLILFATPTSKSTTVSTPEGKLNIVFEDSSSSCALEIANIWGETSNDEIAKSQLNIESATVLYGIQGKVTVEWKTDKENQSIELEVGELVRMNSKEPLSKSEMATAPEWFRTSPGRTIDQFALQDAAKFLKKAGDKALLESLSELAQSKRSETASFAVRVLCQLGRYEGLLGSSGFLARKGAYTHLQFWLPELPNLLGRSESVKAFADAASTNLENRAVDVLRLLITHSQEQLKAGGERLLIESLSSNHQDERLLAIIQLNSLTGKTLGFHPEKNSTDAVAQWRKLLVKEESRPSQSN